MSMTPVKSVIATLSASVAAVPLTLLFVPASAEQREHGASVEKIGTVPFATSWNRAAQPAFNRAVALLHSFEFRRAIEGFSATLTTDPSCAMAEWGIALSRWTNPFAIGI